MTFSKLLDSHKGGGKRNSTAIESSLQQLIFETNCQEVLLLLGDIAKVAGPHKIGGKSILQQPRAVASIAAGQTLCNDALPG